MQLRRPETSRERLIVALDLPSAEEALALAVRLGEEVLWFKVGLELFCSAGARVVEELGATGKRIFLDLKFHDIPNTLAGAVTSVSRLPVQLLTLHAAAGETALRAARDAASSRSDLGLLAVTRLTSQEGVGSGFADVLALAETAARAGLFGVVCPAPAATAVRRELGDSLARVCPGIRPPGAAAHDQLQVAAPAAAVAAGADWIVVGRPITRAADPAAAARRIVRDLEGPGSSSGRFDGPGAER